MAFQNLTVDFKQLSRLTVQERVQLAKSSSASEIFGNMTPTEIAKLFPRYYQQSIPAIGGMTGATSGYSSGGGDASTATPTGQKTSTGSTGGGTQSVAQPPTPKTVVEAIKMAAQKKVALSSSNLQDASNVNSKYKKVSGLTQDQQLKFAAFVAATMEGGPNHQGKVDTMLSMMNRAKKNYGNHGDLFHQLTAKEQYSPISASIYGSSADKHALSVAGSRVSEEDIRNAVSSADPMAALAKLYGRNAQSVEAANKVYQSVIAQDEYYEEARNFVKGRTDYRAYRKYGSDVERAPEDNAFRESGAGDEPASIQDFVAPKAVSSSGKKMIISMGSNDWHNPKNTYENTMKAIENARKKGYDVVIVPPNGNSEKMKAAYAEVMRAANEAGVTVDQPQSYSEDGVHPTEEEYKRIGSQYSDAVVVGDSIGVGIGKYVGGASQTLATEGVGTSTIVGYVGSEQIEEVFTPPDATLAPASIPFDPALLEPNLRQEYEGLDPADQQAFQQAVSQLGYQEVENIRKNFKAPTSSSVVAGEIIQQGAPDQNIKPIPADAESLREFWSQRNPRTDIDRVMEVDPDLLKASAEAIQQYEAANPRYRVELFGDDAASRRSGSMANHGIKEDGYSKALDFVIIDRETGQQIANIGRTGYPGQVGGSELASKEYTRLHSLTRIAQEHFAPHETDVRHGGGFTDGKNAADWQHTDIRAGDEVGGQYNWQTGYTDAWRRKYNIQENLVLGDEQRIKDLGQQIFGQVDEEGNYVNTAAFAQQEDGNVTVVAEPNKRLETPVAEVKSPAESEATQPIEQPGPTPGQSDINIEPINSTPAQVDQGLSEVAGTQVEVLPPAEIPSATPAEPVEEPKQMRLGGTSGNFVDEEISITNAEGDQVNVNPDEKIHTDDSGKLHVENAYKVKADELQQKVEAPPEQQMVGPEPQSPEVPEKASSEPQAPQNRGGMISTPANRLTNIPTDMAHKGSLMTSPSFSRAMSQRSFGNEHFKKGSHTQ